MRGREGRPCVEPDWDRLEFPNLTLGWTEPVPLRLGAMLSFALAPVGSPLLPL